MGIRHSGVQSMPGWDFPSSNSLHLTALRAHPVEHDFEALDFESFRGVCWRDVFGGIFKGK